MKLRPHFVLAFVQFLIQEFVARLAVAVEVSFVVCGLVYLDLAAVAVGFLLLLQDQALGVFHLELIQTVPCFRSCSWPVGPLKARQQITL